MKKQLDSFTQKSAGAIPARESSSACSEDVLGNWDKCPCLFRGTATSRTAFRSNGLENDQVLSVVERITGVRTGENLLTDFERVATACCARPKHGAAANYSVQRLVPIRAGPAGRRDRWLA